METVPVMNKVGVRTLKTAASGGNNTLPYQKLKGPVSKEKPWGRCTTVDGSKATKRKLGKRFT